MRSTVHKFLCQPPPGLLGAREGVRERFHVVVRHHSMPYLETRPNVACDCADIVAQIFRVRRLEEDC